MHQLEHYDTRLPLIAWLSFRGWPSDQLVIEKSLPGGLRVDMAYTQGILEYDFALIVECKKPCTLFAKKQLSEYLLYTGCPLGLWTNGRQYAVLRVQEEQVVRVKNFPLYSERDNLSLPIPESSSLGYMTLN